MEKVKLSAILLIDDDEADREAIERAFRKHQVPNPLMIASGGKEGLRILRGNCSDTLKPPFIVLLDLNMPGLNGFEFLEELRSDPAISDTVIFVLTTSDTDRDKLRAYGRNIAGYILKSKAGHDFENLIKLLEVYGRFVEFPPNRNIDLLSLGERSKF